jgi:hypothetical protein
VDGTFQAAVTYNSGGEFLPGVDTPRFGFASVALAEVNGGRKPDVVIANPCNTGVSGSGCVATSVSVLLGNGDGTFQPSYSLRKS